ncbi:calcium-binding protein [Stieleria varia]|uniref:Hemolysin, plasmid n=1 Tax=Stieleria varia TaxID=2528005 RepID=A0A5C6A0A3_9BACT|nr:calcium-binding protein [Stieleria varia]TWT91963.1 Hemolysin, plasmid [Stieleria varia]
MSRPVTSERNRRTFAKTHGRRRLGFERLEIRRLLAADILDSPSGGSGFIEYSNNEISIHGSSNSDTVQVQYVPFYANPSGITRVLLSNLHGEQIHEYLTMGIHRVRFYGHDGDDHFTNSTSIPSTVFGGNGNDVLNGGNGPDTLSGDAGMDTINGNGGHDQLFGGFGLDTINGGSGNDTIMGGFGSDLLNGGSGNDQINGEHGNDTIDGGWDDDTLLGGQGNDQINGGFGNDYINGGLGADIIDGSFGNDTLLGSHGNDYINGNVGDDNLDGGPGHDQMRGGQGNDSMDGDSGNDSFFGGTGTDSYVGAGGYDRYYLQPEDNAPYVSWADVEIFLHDGGSEPILLLSDFGNVLTMPGTWSLSDVDALDQGLGELVQLTGNNALLQNKGDLNFIRYGDVYDVYADASIGELNTSVGAWNTGSAIALINNTFSSLHNVVLNVQHEIAHNWDEPSENASINAFRDVAWVQSETQPTGYLPALDSTVTDWWYDETDNTFAHWYGKNRPEEDFATSFAAYVGVLMGRNHGYASPEETMVFMAERFAALDAFFATL